MGCGSKIGCQSGFNLEKKLKHLEFIQNVVNRLANTSFLLKGWSITIVGALFAFSAKEGAKEVLWLGLSLTLLFWFLDSYFLLHERRFRALYNQVCLLEESDIDFSMDQMQFSVKHPWYSTVYSLTLLPFYSLATVAQLLFIASLRS